MPRSLHVVRFTATGKSLPSANRRLNNSHSLGGVYARNICTYFELSKCSSLRSSNGLADRTWLTTETVY
eukprot:scaffold352074_cov37-Prasinocladus_malaysianus.AAC.1